MRFKSIMTAADAAVSLLAFEPATLLLKVAIGAAGAAVGAILADPVAGEAAELKKQVEAIKTAAAQKTVMVAVAEG